MNFEVKLRVFIPAPAIAVPRDGFWANLGYAAHEVEKGAREGLPNLAYEMGYAATAALAGRSQMPPYSPPPAQQTQTLSKNLGLARLFGGDAPRDRPQTRYGQYSKGSSRGEVTATINLTTGEFRRSSLDKPGFQFYASQEFDMKDGIRIPGYPSWYYGLRPGARPIRSATLKPSQELSFLGLNPVLEAELLTQERLKSVGDYFHEFVVDTAQKHLIHSRKNSLRVIRLHVRGHDALLPSFPTPPLYAEVVIVLELDAGQLRYSVLGKHGGFPAYEVFIKPEKQSPKRVYAYDPIAKGKSVLSLMLWVASQHTQRINELNKLWGCTFGA